tara:strand:+ start:59 stop:181 length:123 start_codon:yes stop_codon:yes gene_type:complete
VVTLLELLLLTSGIACSDSFSAQPLLQLRSSGNKVFVILI